MQGAADNTVNGTAGVATPRIMVLGFTDLLAIGQINVSDRAPDHQWAASMPWDSHQVATPLLPHSGAARSPSGLPPPGRNRAVPALQPPQLFRFDLTPPGGVSTWPRVTTRLTDGPLHGLRVPVVTGTNVHDLAGSLKHITRRYDSELDRLVQTCTTVLEPLLIVLVALIIGGIAVALLLPVLTITDSLHV